MVKRKYLQKIIFNNYFHFQYVFTDTKKYIIEKSIHSYPSAPNLKYDVT